MKIIGIVGGSGAGKSVLCEALEKRGIPTLDTDKTAREVVQKGKPCLDELVKEFGTRILTPDGELARKALASLAFSDEERHTRLNEITHHYICIEIKKWLSQREKEGFFAACIDAPMLFESGLDSVCDIKVAVVADREARIKRITERDGISRADAENRINAQKSDAELISLCDITVENTGELAELNEKAQELAKRLTAEER